ncbi:type 1 glutamine amidotransferase domain-containing protein [Nocardia caishijiensis]|uniref:Intracellular protease/amidase n=1 Tax=Nocardia caishijiensis TaxID=184756 RepID=A0ABQ6YHY1_9NOCA|nr:type 1 glutamine amidotransferase domain-containing protein [Nocardia caishijiensis]KAF0845383.1 putative intracellular protease/amidase [Nocardia caishijiensis]
MAKFLFVMTGADHWTLADGTEHPTGYWAEEFVAPYEAFTGAGHQVVVATPGGVVPPVDAGSLEAEVNGGAAGAQRIRDVVDGAKELRDPVRLEDVDLAEFDAVYYPGGHGPMEDLAVNKDSAELLTAALASRKPLAVVCHAPAALLATGDASPFAGYRLTGFSNAEETQAGFADKAKWLLEDRLVALGADYSSGQPWAPHVVTDRNLFTGQNPASSAPLAAAVLKALA